MSECSWLNSLINQSVLWQPDNWNTDVTEIPQRHHDALCHFNYQASMVRLVWSGSGQGVDASS